MNKKYYHCSTRLQFEGLLNDFSIKRLKKKATHTGKKNSTLFHKVSISWKVAPVMDRYDHEMDSGTKIMKTGR